MSLSSKSCTAFLKSAASLWQPGLRVYFWTVTFREVRADWEQSAAFTAFLEQLRRQVDPDMGGVKVGELHPGGHGVHYHLLVNRRISVHLVRKLGRRYGIGRIFVEVADQNAGPEYLAKYLSKRGDHPLCKSGRNQRRWSCFGKVPRRCRCSDLQFENPMWLHRRAHQMPFVGYRFEPLLDKAWMRGLPAFRLAYSAARAGDMGTVMAVVNRAGWDVVLDGTRKRAVLAERFETWSTALNQPY